MSVSDLKKLIELAQKALTIGDLERAKHCYLQYLSVQHDIKCVIALGNIFLQEKRPDEAYKLLKDESDLFSDDMLFKFYLKVLQERHFYIEAKQVSYLLGKPLAIEILPIVGSDADKIMLDFHKLNIITQEDYIKLYSLDEETFIEFSKSLLLDPTTNFMVKATLCNDFIKLGVSQKSNIRILGQMQSFVPADTSIFYQNSIYKYLISFLKHHYENNPSKMNLLVNEITIFCEVIFPCIEFYIIDADKFARCFIDYINGESDNINEYTKLLNDVYAELYRFNYNYKIKNN